MAERDDRMAQDARDAQRGDESRGRNDRPDLAGDIERNRNLTGSTTYETLSEEGDLDVASRNDADRKR